jgi:hypothetical protein
VDHVVEEAVAAPPPRRARLPLRLTGLLLVAALLLGTFAVGGGRALWEAARLGWLAAAGHTTAGKVVAIRTVPSDAAGRMPVPVALRYAADLPGPQGPQRRTAWVGLGVGPATRESFTGGGSAAPSSPPAPDPAYAVGEAFPVRSVAWFGGVTSQPWSPAPRGLLFTLFLTGGLVLLVSLLLLRRLAHWTADRLHLLRAGVATVGTILHTRTEAEDSVRYFLHYGYAVSEGGTLSGREREEQVGADQWKRFSVGQPVTVLYDPAQPDRAGLYALIMQR